MPLVGGVHLADRATAADMPCKCRVRPWKCRRRVTLTAISRLRAPRGSSCRPMIPVEQSWHAWTTATNFRGWDMWVQQRRIGMHIIHRWPETALKTIANTQVPANQWVHVAVTYDGSRSAGGVRVFYDGQQQATNFENNTLLDQTQSTRTDVPFRVGQRTTQNPFSGGVHEVRLYQRRLRNSEVQALARAEWFANVVSLPAEERGSAAPDDVVHLVAGRHGSAVPVASRRQRQVGARKAGNHRTGHRSPT